MDLYKGGLALLLCAIPATCAKEDCSSRKIAYPVRHSEYKKLQEFVNEGHQPWRLHAPAVAGSKSASWAYAPSIHCDAYSIPFKEDIETPTNAGAIGVTLLEEISSDPAKVPMATPSGSKMGTDGLDSGRNACKLRVKVGRSLSLNLQNLTNWTACYSLVAPDKMNSSLHGLISHRSTCGFQRNQRIHQFH